MIISEYYQERLILFQSKLEKLKADLPRTYKKEMPNLLYNIKVTEDKIKEIYKEINGI